MSEIGQNNGGAYRPDAEGRGDSPALTRGNSPAPNRRGESDSEDDDVPLLELAKRKRGQPASSGDDEIVETPPAKRHKPRTILEEDDIVCEICLKIPTDEVAQCTMPKCKWICVHCWYKLNRGSTKKCPFCRFTMDFPTWNKTADNLIEKFWKENPHEARVRRAEVTETTNGGIIARPPISVVGAIMVDRRNLPRPPQPRPSQPRPLPPPHPQPRRPLRPRPLLLQLLAWWYWLQQCVWTNNWDDYPPPPQVLLPSTQEMGAIVQWWWRTIVQLVVVDLICMGVAYYLDEQTISSWIAPVPQNWPQTTRFVLGMVLGFAWSTIMKFFRRR